MKFEIVPCSRTTVVHSSAQTRYTVKENDARNSNSDEESENQIRRAKGRADVRSELDLAFVLTTPYCWRIASLRLGDRGERNFRSVRWSIVFENPFRGDQIVRSR